MDREKATEIVKNILKGDEESFRIFYEEFFPKIYKYAYKRVKNREVAEDLTSETFMKIIKGLKDFEVRGDLSLDIWIYAIERNTVRDWFRRNLGVEVLPFEEKWEQKFQPVVSDPYITEEVIDIRNFVMDALEEIPPQYKEIIELRFFKNKRISEIATFLEKSEDNVKVTQYRALKALKEKLKEKLENEE